MIDMIVDGNSLYARSWFAAQRMTTDPAEALRLCIQTLLSLLNPDSNRIGFNFTRMFFGWDAHQNPSKEREAKPQEYYDTREIFKDTLTFMFGAAHHEQAPYEGDDIVATAVYSSKADDIYVISGDKDLMQLQGGNVHYYSLNEKAVLSDHFILSRWHVKHPTQIAIALAVIGDPVDNIKGVPNWGPKRCRKLFESVPEDADFETALEAVSSQIPDSLKPHFWESLGRTLVETNVPGVPDPAPICLADPADVEALGIPQIGFAYRQVYHTYTVEPY